MIREINKIISPVYEVGGCVRDQILGITPKDYDYTTPILPEDMEVNLKAAGRRVYGIGKKFGTLGFKLNGNFIEVTTFRSEVYTPGSRKPTVEFVKDIKDDLSRRDFTINAIAKDVDGNRIDPFLGGEDIIKGIIRAVGSPSLRFIEDPLRLLRMSRFVGQFGFKVDKDTHDHK